MNRQRYRLCRSSSRNTQNLPNIEQRRRQPRRTLLLEGLIQQQQAKIIAFGQPLEMKEKSVGRDKRGSSNITRFCKSIPSKVSIISHYIRSGQSLVYLCPIWRLEQNGVTVYIILLGCSKILEYKKCVRYMSLFMKQGNSINFSVTNAGSQTVEPPFPSVLNYKLLANLFLKFRNLNLQQKFEALILIFSLYSQHGKYWKVINCLIDVVFKDTQYGKRIKKSEKQSSWYGDWRKRR